MDEDVTANLSASDFCSLRSSHALHLKVWLALLLHLQPTCQGKLTLRNEFHLAEWVFRSMDIEFLTFKVLVIRGGQLRAYGLKVSRTVNS